VLDGDGGEARVEAVFTNIEVWMAGLGVWALVAAPLVMVVVSILPIPAEAAALANGMLFGPLLGTAITWVGAMLGAWISYEIARSGGRSLAGRCASDEALGRVDAAAASAGWWGLLILRFVPLVAFTALNWGSGLCGVPRGRFLWTTALGITPGVIFFTSSGAGLGALWRRSPLITVTVVTVLLVISVLWAVRRRKVEVAPY
jgi:uncharacterized membrane protein YdjX (TVP38/TMEM64 family)